jgi:polyhydroxyalkanoate synthesis regulator phasin
MERTMSENEQSSLEKVILAGIGAITKTAETAGEMLEELVKKGELTIEQGKALNEELKHGFKDKR